MNSTRQQKFARLIQKELAKYFQFDAKSMYSNMLISVTHVEVSPDLGVAKVYLSFMLSHDKEATLQHINANKKLIRQTLGKKIRNQVRVIPELIFLLNDSVDYVLKMENIIKNLNIPPESHTPDA
ncbi:MAG: 30S ribosome-binding factor RbfA [Cytophagales bacterium]|nr:30S ribosome-binding factor RbfA [Cytophagales bacterium]